MSRRDDPLGRLLQERGLLDEEGIARVLHLQAERMPFASVCWILGLASEDELARALAKRVGVPGIVLSRTVLDLEALTDVPREIALDQRVLPVLEEQDRLHVAVADPSTTRPLRELELIKGKAVIPHVAVEVPLLRTIQAAYTARAAGRRTLAGDALPMASAHLPTIHIVSDVDELSWPMVPKPAEPMDDATRELDLLSEQELLAEAPAIQLDADGTSEIHTAPPASRRVLIVDDDFASRHVLSRVLASAGFDVDVAVGGQDGIKRLRAGKPHLVVAEMMLPEIDGGRLARSIKASRKYGHVPVVLLTSDPRLASPEVAARHGADAALAKPVNADAFLLLVRELVDAVPARPEAPRDRTFDEAIAATRAGRIDEAIGLLRTGIANDPLSARHHFVLANLLQRKSLVYEAIDAFEVTVSLRPDYFPALSRLAYLYYSKGFSAKALDTWRRSLVACTDPELRANIEGFVQRLEDDLRTRT